MKIDFDIVDNEYYPTDEFLNFIKEYNPRNNLSELIEFINLIGSVWYHSDYFVFRKKYKGIRKLELHSMGWSGNESIIEAILENTTLSYYLRYVKWTIGGHYYFDVKVGKKFYN